MIKMVTQGNLNNGVSGNNRVCFTESAPTGGGAPIPTNVAIDDIETISWIAEPVTAPLVVLQTFCGRSPVCGCPIFRAGHLMFIEHYVQCGYGQYLYVLSNEHSRMENQAAEIICNVKEYSRTKYEYRSTERADHARQAVVLAAAKLAKKNKRKRVRGRLENQSSSLDREIFYDATEELLWEEILQAPSDDIDYMSFVARVAALLGNLYTCQTWDQYTAAGMQFMASFVTGRLVKDLAHILSDLGESPLENQSNIALPSFDTVREHMIKVSKIYSGLETLPIYDHLSNLCVLAALVGLIPDTLSEKGTVIACAYDMWRSRVNDRVRATDYCQLVIDICAFSLEFVQGLCQGVAGKFFVPSELIRDATELVALRTNFQNGTLDAVDMNIAEYSGRVADILQLLAIHVRNVRGPSAVLYQRLRSQLMEISCEIKTSGAYATMTPPAPVILYAGESQIGKSLLMFETAYFVGNLLGFSSEEADIWYPQKADEFDSGLTASKTIIIDDDVAAEKLEYTTAKAATNFLRYSNIIPYLSNQAELTKKGAIPLNHKLVLMSTNVPHLNLHNMMAHPEAAYNRALMVEVSILPEFKVQGSERIDTAKAASDELGADAYRFRIYTYTRRAVTQAPLGKGFGKAPKMREISPGVTRVWLTEPMTKPEYFAYLRDYLLNQKNSGSKYIATIRQTRAIPFCPTCHLWRDGRGKFCQCVENQMFETVRRAIINPMYTQVLLAGFQYVPDFGDFVRNDVVPLWMRRYGIPMIDSAIYYGANVVSWLALRALLCVRRSTALVLWFSICLSIICWILCSRHYFFIPRSMLLVWIFLTYCFLVRIKRGLADAVVRELQQNTQYSAFYMAGKAALGFSALVTFASLMRRMFRHSLVDQGNLRPTTKEDVEVRNKEPNMWLNAHVNRPVREGKLMNMIPDHVQRMYFNNVVRAEFMRGSSSIITTNALFVASNLLLISKHVFERVDIKSNFKIYTKQDMVGGCMRKVVITSHVDVHPDLILAVVSSAASFKNIVEFFAPTLVSADACCLMISRSIEGELEERKLLFSPQMVENQSARAHGSYHECDIPTLKGNCGAPVFLAAAPQYIVGIHCAGSPVGVARPRSAAFSVTREMITTGIDNLRKMHGARYVGAVPMLVDPPLENQYDMAPLAYEEFHERDVVRYVGWDKDRARVFPIGSVPGARTHRHSDVLTTFLSEPLAAGGIPNKWGPPKFNVNRNHADTFQALLQPIDLLPEAEIAWACEDYLSTILQTVGNLEMQTQPLTWQEAINGDPARKYVRRMNMHTASGYGLKGTKDAHFERVEYENSIEYIPKPYIVEEYTRVEQRVKDGFLPHHIFTSALKDEPTPIGKDKVRVFQVSPISLVLVMRKYILPVIDHLYAIPIDTEMAQGINCTNSEWDQVARYLRSMSVTHGIEGDFSKYDLRQSGQIIRACGYILRRCAESMGYSQQDANIVELLVSEISFKPMLFNGTVFDVDGVNPSGVPITIVLNSMCNSLLHRIMYMRIARQKGVGLEPFRSGIALITQGDDSIATTKWEWFNMVSLQTEFAKIYMPYTDGHKSAVTIPFFHCDELAFCKRQLRYEERVQKYVAPIALDSIWKSLHCCMKSKTPQLEVVVGNVNGALRELARHDKPTFERYYAVILTACERAEISPYVKMLKNTYEDWWVEFSFDYESDEVSSLTPEDSFPGSGEVSESLDYDRVEPSFSAVITELAPDNASDCLWENTVDFEE